MIGPVRLYQLLISPLLPHSRCRFHPSCSRYSVDAVNNHGVIKGGVATAWRILRCQPYGGHGLDPAEEFTWPWELEKRRRVRALRTERENQVDQMATEMECGH